MILEWLLSPIADKNTFTGGIIDSVCETQTARRNRASLSVTISQNLHRREVEALEKIAKNLEDK